MLTWHLLLFVEPCCEAHLKCRGSLFLRLGDSALALASLDPQAPGFLTVDKSSNFNNIVDK